MFVRIAMGLPFKIIAFLVFAGIVFTSSYKAHYLYPERTDLLICLNAARRLWEGLLVYDISQNWAHTKPPFATLLFLPLEFFSRSWIVGLWDLLNVVVLFVMSFVFAREIHKSFAWDVFYTTLLGVFLVLNFWGYELRFGQYNLLTLAMLWWAGRSSSSKLSAVLFWSAFFIKPSNLLFAPWVWFSLSSRSPKNKRELLVSSVIFLCALALTYGTFFGFARVFEDHLEWLSFMRLATAKYLMRDVNYGFPLFFGYFTESSLPQHLLLLVSLVWAWLWAKRYQNTLLAFGAAAALSLMASPMTWWATFCILLPLSMFVFVESVTCLRKGQHRFRAIVGLLIVILGTQLIFPNPIMALAHRLSNPNWVYLIYLGMAFKLAPKRAKGLF